MADLKISQLTGATTPLAGTEVVPLVQSGSTKKVAVSDILHSTTDYVKGQYQNGAANNSTGAGLTSSAKTTGAAAAGFGSSLNFDHYDSGGGYAGSKIESVMPSGDPFVADLALYARNYGYVEGPRVKAATGNFSFPAAKGVDFSANTGAAGKTSSLLNWYEEGTWAPDLTTAGGNFSSLTFGDASGTYTRVGRQVTVRGSFYTTGTVSGGSGQVYITGLPFSAASQAIGNVWVNPDTVNYNSPSALPTGVFSSGTQLRLFKNGSVNNTTFNSTDLATSGFANNIFFTCTYFV